MKEFRNFDDVHRYLHGLMSETRSRKEAYTLDRMRTLMDFLGNPQDSYKTIHVAGTSGKTSTCYYLSALLGASGKKIGLAVSPHIEEVNERVQLNNQPLSESEFCQELSTFLQTIKPSGIQPTYFELLVAFAFWEFARQQVDYAVIEVGLGGLLDGTNVMRRADKVCVITDIGYDHTATLGKTLAAIAGQKAGIILSHNNVFSYTQSREVMSVLRQVCLQKRASLHEIAPSQTTQVLPLFQQRNWQLAHQVSSYLSKRDGLPALSPAQLSAAAHTAIPGRMETFQIGDKVVILDGAHNSQKLTALLESVAAAHPKKPIACLLSFVRISEQKVGKNLTALLPHINHLIITDFQDDESEHHATNPAVIAAKSETLNYREAETVPDLTQALERLLARPEPVLLVTGSFFLLQHLRPLIINTYDPFHSRP